LKCTNDAIPAFQVNVPALKFADKSLVHLLYNNVSKTIQNSKLKTQNSNLKTIFILLKSLYVHTFILANYAACSMRNKFQLQSPQALAWVHAKCHKGAAAQAAAPPIADPSIPIWVHLLRCTNALEL
jgi:hypothetical protein